MPLPESIHSAMLHTNSIFTTSVIANGDFDALDSVYTATARILPPGAPLISGLPAIKDFSKSAIAGLHVVSATLTTVDAELCGHDVIEIGAAELHLQGGAIVPVKYIVHWKLENDTWKWNSDIWNTNA